MGKPTIAVVNGPARAAGVTVAVSCDCIIASEAASFGYPEIDVGVIPAMHYVHLPGKSDGIKHSNYVLTDSL